MPMDGTTKRPGRTAPRRPPAARVEPAGAPPRETPMKLEARTMESARDSSPLLRERLRALAETHRGQPQAFRLRADLLAQGRANIPVAATDDLTVMVK
ncbi:MAG: hypothetical protein ACK559_02645, partial [bacterium]